MNWKWYLVLGLLLLLIIFILQNYEIVKVNFLFWSFQTSRAIIILVTLCIGAATGWIISLLRKG